MSQICSCSNNAKKKKNDLTNGCGPIVGQVVYFISILLKKLFINLLMKKS